MHYDPPISLRQNTPWRREKEVVVVVVAAVAAAVAAAALEDVPVEAARAEALVERRQAPTLAVLHAVALDLLAHSVAAVTMAAEQLYLTVQVARPLRA
jgi:hypothetical protein